ncbi:MAG: DUF1156 domain-containing protein, partial [Bacteroidales bacterium]|nr:DUF1156 domain-containing protein [Bacteroidales bacterium]
MQNCKKLIEVAMPIKEISAESVRDKSIRHGHISTLHLWWARRPLSVCRAVVFASLVPDPLDKNCPQAFRDAVKILLGKSNNISDSYKPYDDIPYTAAIDKMEDNLRNRLLMFIGKFSERYILNEKQGRKTDSKDALSDSSLIKWDNRNNEEVLNKARKLIWVAHNSANGVDANKMLAEFEEYFKAIKDAENSLYNLENRHIKSESIKFKEKKLQDAINSFLDKMPKVFDPFAGGGAIPLESSRLGCRSFGNDLNPVAHIVQKGSVEFPQKFGKPITYSKSEFINLYGESEFRNVLPENKILNNGEVVAVRINNRLSFDIGILSNILILKAKQLFSYLYPDGERNESLVANIWARVAKCKNPSCKAEVPLLRQFYLVNKDNNSIFLQPQIKGNKIEFEIKNGLCHENPWVNRGNLTCPCCKNVTDVNVIKSQFVAGQTKERLLAVIYENKEGKIYRLPSKVDFDAFNLTPDPYEIPFEKMQRNSAGGDTFTWGIDTWSSLLSKRQLYSILELIKLINDDSLFEQYKRDIEYKKALKTYLAILIDRFADYNTRHCVWISNMELIAHLFGRQAIPMNLDYAESNPLGNSTGSLLSQLNWIQRYIESESINPFSSICVNTASGNLAQFPLKSLDAVITDPPYFDAIAYADISDYFYVWLKRSLKSEYPYNFSTPQTPKSEECTALKHH